MTTDKRPFGFWTATALVVGGMIGSGIFMMPAALAPFGWTGTLAWVVSITGALSIAYVLGRLAQAMPQATGAVAIAGSVLGELPGVLIGWSYWVAVWCANAAIAIAATSYLSALLPALNATPLTGALTAVALIWLLTLLNLAGARRAGQFQVLTTLLKLAPLLAVLVIAALLGAKGEAALPALPESGTLFAGLAAAVTLTLFPLVGFEAAGIAAERVRDPARNILRASMVGTVVTGLLYILVCSAIVLLLDPVAVAGSSAPFALFVGQFWGGAASKLVAAFAAIAAIGALNGWVLIQGEVPLGMARAGLLPKWFCAVSSRDVPVRVLLLSSGLASALILTTSSPTLGGVFQILAVLTTCTTLWLYLAVCVAALMRRIAVPAAAIGTAFSLFAFWGAGWEASGMSLVLMLTAVPLYFLRNGNGGAKFLSFRKTAVSKGVSRLEFAAFVSITVAVLLGLNSIIYSSASSTGKLQAAAILAATAGWLYNNSVLLRTKLRERAFSVIDSDLISGEISKYSRPLANFMIQNSEFDWKNRKKDVYEFYYDYTFDNDGIIHCLLKTGDVYENIAIMIRRDTIDEQIIRDYFEGTFKRCFECFWIFVDPIRNLPDSECYRSDRAVRPKVGEHMEWLYARWFGKDQLL